MGRLLLLLALLGLGGWQLFTLDRPVAPETTLATGPGISWRHNGVRITPLQRFELDARVLGTRSYRHDNLATLAPVDLALGWGLMADPAVLRDIDIDQDNRAYFWRVHAATPPRRAIEAHSANMHMIPASRDIEKRLRAVEPGSRVTLSGWLVALDADKWHAQSSLTRFDTGPGACEIVWVEQFDVH
ncbi:hypothetical protein [Derxia gummosa]|uniref:Uncharacterized protein n=1 Tax=Derxia gummosa DSM 723 TaxID=1121388 RepID=A0A8B6X888_9BURK|nr:hypothetical protein [Derxia gummosa]